MAGGNFQAQNKVLPGVYINYRGKGANPSVVGERGSVGLPVTFPWLPEHVVYTVTSKEAMKLYAEFGADALPIREAAKNASSINLFRLNKGTAAAVTIENLVATALYSGTYGNRFSVSVEVVVGESNNFHVVTWFDGTEMERQTVTAISKLTANAWLTFAQIKGGADTLAASAGKPLLGGLDGTITNADHVAALEAFETINLDAVACPSADNEVKSLYIAFAKRMIADEGKYLQVVVADSVTADFEAVISVKNGVILDGGSVVSNITAAAYVAGATAACPLAGSLSNAAYIGAVDVDVRYTKTQQIDLAKSGQLVFLPPAPGAAQVTIQKDINTLVTFGGDKTYALSKNKTIRTIYTLNNDITRILNTQFIGKVPNDEDGRSQVKGVILERFRELAAGRVLRDVVAEDIVVTQGTLVDAVVVTYTVRIVDVTEVFYITVTAEG